VKKQVSIGVVSFSGTRHGGSGSSGDVAGAFPWASYYGDSYVGDTADMIEFGVRGPAHGCGTGGVVVPSWSGLL
jgi:hypothetical protein